MGYKNVWDLPDHRREFLLEVVGLYKEVKTLWSEGKRQKRRAIYDRFHTSLKKIAKLGVQIRPSNAELLVRFHPSMPNPFVPLSLLGQVPPRGLIKREPCGFVQYSPHVIQEYFAGTGSFREQARRSLTLLALRSIEWFEKIEARAQTLPLCFDALNTAARLVIYPYPVIFRSSPTRERVLIWKYTVEKNLITRPPAPRGPDMLTNITRNFFFYNAAQDLEACGLHRHKNEVTDETTVSACDVLEAVYGKPNPKTGRKTPNSDTIKKVVQDTEKLVNLGPLIGEDEVTSPDVLWMLRTLVLSSSVGPLPYRRKN